MEQIFFIASIWLGLALCSAVIAYHLRISIALVEICIGVFVAALLAYSSRIEALALSINHPGWHSLASYVVAAFSASIGKIDVFGANQEWLRFLASSGAVLLTFLAGAELEPAVIRMKFKEVSIVGLVGFIAPFMCCSAIAYFWLGWNLKASMLCGVALSTTSMAVVYAVMLETGFNKTMFGKGILGSCFVNDLGTVIALGLIFSPFTYKTIIFIVASAAVLSLLPYVTRWLTRTYAHRTAAVRTKFILIILFGLGALALWSGSEAVLPAYLVGMVLAESANQDTLWIKRLRTLTVGFLTPFYFLRAGTLVSLPALLSAPLVFAVLLGGKVLSKIFGLYPVIRLFRSERKEQWYYTLM
ncbi:MAG: cation:proton antiporter, partial [Candidatus Scalindua sp.]|nr:cation:proton antiporter [Candidatus Scalindua sp.]